MSAVHVLQTTWAALRAVSAVGNFGDERDRQEMSDLADSLEHAEGEISIDLDAHDTNLAMEALLVAFRALRPVDPTEHPAEDTLAGALTPERVGLAYLTFADQVDRWAAASYDLTEAALASVALGMHVLKSSPVMTDELHDQIEELIDLRDLLEGLLNTGSPLQFLEVQAFTLRQNVITSLSLIGTRPDVVQELDIMPDLLAALTGSRLNALLEHLTAQRQHSVGQA